MTVEIDKDMIRLLVLDVSGVYSNVVNETYVTKDIEQEIRNQYSDEKYMVVRTM